MPMHPHGHGFTHYGVFGYEGEVWTIAGVEFIPAAAVKAGVAVVAHHKVMPFGHLPNAIAAVAPRVQVFMYGVFRSEEHTSELQSRGQLVCRLLLEKKKKRYKNNK